MSRVEKLHAELDALYANRNITEEQATVKESQNMLLKNLAEAGDAIESYYDCASRGYGEANPIYRKVLTIIDAELALESVDVLL